MRDEARIIACIPRLRRYARALVGRRDEADDLVQDTLERAWSKLRLWRPGSDPRVWLFSIMHNVHVDQVRYRRARPAEVLGDDALQIPAQVAPSDVLQLRRLAFALDQLPPGQREVLLLVGLEGLTYEETARALGIPVGTVMSRLSRGRDGLRALMDGGASAASLRLVE
jgi:RNA polymerase sigma-70 factor (ECF subfamily)